MSLALPFPVFSKYLGKTKFVRSASFLQSERQLCIKALVWIAGRAGYKDTQTCWNQTARDAGDFLLLQLASTSPAKYSVIVEIRHKIPPSSLGVFF